MDDVGKIDIARRYTTILEQSGEESRTQLFAQTYDLIFRLGIDSVSLWYCVENALELIEFGDDSGLESLTDLW